MHGLQICPAVPPIPALDVCGRFSPPVTLHIPEVPNPRRERGSVEAVPGRLPIADEKVDVAEVGLRPRKKISKHKRVALVL